MQGLPKWASWALNTEKGKKRGFRETSTSDSAQVTIRSPKTNHAANFEGRIDPCRKNLIPVSIINYRQKEPNLVRSMTIPPEIAWLIPTVLPFIIGLLVGAVIKKGLKLLIAVAALIIILVVTGILSVTFSGLYAAAMQFLPKLYDLGHGWLNVLPYSSVAFLIGLALGFLFA